MMMIMMIIPITVSFTALKKIYGFWKSSPPVFWTGDEESKKILSAGWFLMRDGVVSYITQIQSVCVQNPKIFRFYNSRSLSIVSEHFALYTPSKNDAIIFFISSPNIDRFSKKSLHW